MTHTSAAPTEVAPPDGAAVPRLVGRRAAVVISSLIVGVIAYQLGATMVAPTLPDIAEEFGAETTSVAQVTAMFFVAGSIAGVVGTRWSDFIGRRRTLLIVLGIAAVGSTLALFAPNLGTLIVARTLQGVASGSFQITFVLLGQRLRPKTFALMVAVLSAINGGVAGFDGVLGGWLADTYSFRAVFGVILVFTVLALVVVAAFVPRGETRHTAGTMDWWGAAFMAAMLFSITKLVAHGSADGWGAPSTLTYAAVFAVSVLAFVLIERRRSSPLIDPRHLVSRRIWPLLSSTVLFTIALSAVIYFTVVLLAQNPTVGFGLPAALAALLYITPAAAVAAISSPFTGWVTSKLGWTLTYRTGLVLSAAVIAFVAVFPTERWAVFGALACLGITYKGMCIAPVSGLGVLLAPKNAPGALPGLIGAAFGIGNGLGVTTVAAAVGRGTLPGFTTALWISFAFAIAALGVAFLIPRVTAAATSPDRAAD